MSATVTIDTAQVLIWLAVPREMAPVVGNPIEESGRDYTVTKVVPSKTTRGTVNVEAMSEDWDGNDAGSVLLVGGYVAARAKELLTTL